MKVYTPKSATSPTVTIDTSKPIVIFDPWPFAARSVAIVKESHYWFDGIKLHLRDGESLVSAIHQADTDFLATATDGKLVLGSVNALRRAGI